MRQLLSVLFLACVTPALAEPIAADSPRWKIEHGESSIVSLKGQRALFLNGAIATLADANFDTGVIEFDMLLPSAAQSFPGIYFRGQDDDNHEHFYLRPHQNGRPDANQYTPVINGVTGWQIYSQYNGRMTYRLNEWFHVRLEVADDSAQIYVDAPDQPALAVHDLKRERKAGYIALKGSLGGAYYANINITRAQPEAAPPEPAKELPAGLVRAWSVSPAMAEAEALAAAGGNRLNALSWTTLPVETNGIATLESLARCGGITFKPKHGHADALERVRNQARVQFESRGRQTPLHELKPFIKDEGLQLLPEPTPGDVFLDLEGDPFAAEGGREYLFGIITLDAAKTLVYREWWGLSEAEEKQA